LSFYQANDTEAHILIFKRELLKKSYILEDVTWGLVGVKPSERPELFILSSISETK